MFTRVLVANRGEIACRVIRALYWLGIRSIAVHSEADARARHVSMADESHCIGPAPAAQSYLDVDRIIDAARRSGAEAIHPGYGFLSENAEFAAACAHAGITFIGPSPDVIRRMGLKHEAKAIVAAAGVPVIPGYLGERQDEATLLGEGVRIGFPLLVKAVAGGGGRGMRVAREAAELPEAIRAARAEAEAAFGDGRVMLERFVERPRHVEVQVFGDTFGRHVHLFERECSVQRRYQKIIEESPSPALTPELRERMTAAAVRAAAAVGYVNAGTIEFTLAPDGQFYFMEMNTRLQVEHPVTEMVTGIDLVEWQLRVAAGEPLPLAQDDIVQRGHAIEVRLCCEDPSRGFLPSVGRIERFAFPTEEEGWRIDRGVDDRDQVTVYYDPMVAKLIAWAPDRAAAIARLRSGLERTALFGLRSNLPLLRRILAHPEFSRGAIDTTFIDRHLDELLAPSPEPSAAAMAVAAASVLAPAFNDDTPWLADGWQASALGGSTLGLSVDGAAPRRLRARRVAGGIELTQAATTASWRVEPVGEDRMHAACGDESATLTCISHGTRLLVTDGATYEIESVPPWPRRLAEEDAGAHPSSPLPGRIVALNVAVGDTVVDGQTLAVVEGMKMQVPVKAARSGVVTRVLVTQGALVDADALLLEIGDPA